MKKYMEAINIHIFEAVMSIQSPQMDMEQGGGRMASLSVIMLQTFLTQ